jgi:DNA-directed RNA polymerase subunit N (RpoN/RPB10)
LGKGKPIGRAWKGYIRKISEKLNLKIMEEFEIPTEYFIILSTQ